MTAQASAALSSSLSARAKRLRNDVIYATVGLFVALLTRLPRRLTVIFCRALGAIAYVILGSARHRARSRLQAGLGSERIPGATVRAAFASIGAMLADTLCLLRPFEQASTSLSLDPASRAVFHEALDEGRGVVFVAAHLGPWERMAALLAEQGFPVAAVARESSDPRITRIYEKIRRPRGVRSIYRKSPGAPMAIARELARGGAVGFLIDLPSRVPCARARLFGEEADIPLGPARIALARQAAVVVGTCAPAPNGGESSPIVLITRIPTGDLTPGTEGEAELMRRLAQALEARIRAWPEAWLGLFVRPRLRADDVPR
ncbi:MAG: lysophospholipid acyltransferase family protein [Polyangiaceae bacterium]|nr:lysophospholipid acyltransferase family protein [Polyangiaceae bacterium]